MSGKKGSTNKLIKPKKGFRSTSRFSPLNHTSESVKAKSVKEPSTGEVLNQILGMLAKNQREEVAPRAERVQYSNSKGFPQVGRKNEKDTVQWFDDMNNEWRSFDNLMAMVEQLRSFKDWATNEINQLKARVGGR